MVLSLFQTLNLVHGYYILVPMLIAVFIYHQFSKSSELNLTKELEKSSSELRQFEKIVEEQTTRIKQWKNHRKVLIVDKDLSEKEN